jgi:glycosyltransferase involved in cell wall biosynthesis
VKNRIHFHSDCPFFAGCENMLVNFFQDRQFLKDYQVSFSYRHSASYESGLKQRVSTELDIRPLKLLDIAEFINQYPSRVLSIILKILCRIIFVKYWFILWNTIVIYKMFGEEKIDVLHINNGGYPGAYSCMSAVFAAKLRGIKKIVYVVNNLAVPYNSFQRWADFPLDLIVAKEVTVFVTGSAFAGEKLRDVLKLPPNKYKNIHNGITARGIIQTPKEVLKRLCIDNDRLIMAIVAVIEERKGHVFLLQALKHLMNQGYDSRLPYLVIEGSGSQLEKLIRYVEDNGLKEIVKFIGNEKNIFDLLNAADIIVLPSITNEDFPNVILEAMSLGKPVIASRLAGTPEQVVHMETGILVEPGDVKGLADAITMLVDNRSLLEEMGEKARQKFNDCFTATKSVSNYTNLYKRLLREVGK